MSSPQEIQAALLEYAAIKRSFSLKLGPYTRPMLQLEKRFDEVLATLATILSELDISMQNGVAQAVAQAAARVGLNMDLREMVSNVNELTIDAEKPDSKVVQALLEQYCLGMYALQKRTLPREVSLGLVYAAERELLKLASYVGIEFSSTGGPEAKWIEKIAQKFKFQLPSFL